MADMPKCYGLARSHINTPEMYLALFHHNLLHQVEVANRDTPGGKNQIILDGLLKLLTQALNCIARNAQAHRFGSGLSRCCLDQIAVAIANLAGPERFIHVNDLVASRQNSHTRPPNHRHAGITERRQYANLPGSNLAPARQYYLPTPHIFACRSNIVPWCDLFKYLDPLALWPLAAR